MQFRYSLSFLILVLPFSGLATTQSNVSGAFGRKVLLGSGAEIYHSQCVQCHGPQGVSEIDIVPNIRGQKILYIEQQLKDFRDGRRYGNYMPRAASKLSDTDITNLALYILAL